MTISQFLSTPSTVELRDTAQKEQQQAIEAKYEDTSLWGMSQKLDNAYHIFNDYGDDFEEDPEFDLNTKAGDIKGLSEYVQNAVMDVVPESEAQLNHIIETAQESEKAMTEYSQMGASGFTAHALSMIRDPAALAIGVGTGGLGVAARLGVTGRAAMVMTEAVAAESVVATARLANNPTYTAKDALVDIAMSPLTAALPVYLGSKLSPLAQRSRKMANENMMVFRDAALDMATSTGQAAQRADDVYQAAFLKARADRFAVTQKSEFQVVRDVGKRMYDDSVGTMGDKAGQGATAEGVASYSRDFITSNYHKQVAPAFKAIFKETGVRGHQKKQAALRKAQRNIIKAKEKGDFSALTQGEKQLMEAQNETLRRAHASAADAGNLHANAFAHSNNYHPIRYLSGKIREHADADVVALFTKAFMQGGVDLAEVEARVLAKAMHGKITQANFTDTASSILDDPEVFFKQLTDDAQLLGLDEEALTNLISKYKKPNEKHFKRRADLDRTVEIQLENGQTLSMLDLIDADPLASMHGYTNRMTAHAGLAKGLGVVDDEGWEALMKKAQAESPAAVKELNEMRNVLFGYPTHDVSQKWAQRVTTVNNMMTGTALGNSGMASLPDLFISIQRSGFVAAIKSLPLWGKTTSKELQELMDISAYHQLGIDAPYLSSMFASMAEEGVEGGQSAIGAAARKMANTTVRASGLSTITEWTQKTAYFGSVREAFKAVRKGKDIPLAKAETGWSTAEHARMTELLRTSAPMKLNDAEFGRSMSIPDMKRWSFEDRDIFLRGMYKYSLRAASRVTRGESIAALEHPLARVVTQFRNVVINSYHKRALSNLTRLGTAQGAKHSFTSAVTQSAGLYMMYNMRIESKTSGMSREEKTRYVTRQGFKSLREYKKFASGDLDTIMNVKGSVIAAMGSYSPTHGSLFTLADIAAGLGGHSIGGGRYKPVEDTLFSAPAVGYLENMTRLATSGWDGEVTQQEANRMKSLFWMNSQPVLQYGFNSLIEASDLKDK